MPQSTPGSASESQSGWPLHLHRLPADEVLRWLGTGPRGLASEEARHRLERFGRNEIPSPGRERPVFRIVRQLTHFLALLLWAAAGLAFLGERLEPGSGMTALGWAIVAVIVVNAAFSFFQEERAERAAEALQRLLPRRAAALRDGEETAVPRANLVPGDVVRLREGDLVPADARVIEAHRLQVSNATLTGESAAEMRSSEPSDLPLLESPNLVFAGTTVVSGVGTAVVTGTGLHTEFAHIAGLAQQVRTEAPPLVRELRRVTHVVTVVAVGTGVGFFLLGEAAGRSFWQSFVFAIGILVANVPEGLLPTVTLALAMASQRMARRNALLKDLPSVEALGATTAICTDKTGTLTEGRMVFSCLVSRGKTVAEGVGLAAAERANPMLFAAFRHCNDARCGAGGGEAQGDPIDRELLRVASPPPPADVRLGEIPFDSERRRMTVVSELGGTAHVLVKGALESVLPLCASALDADGAVPITAAAAAIRESEAALARDGLRVLAFAGRRAAGLTAAEAESEVVERDLVFLGLAGFLDPPRAGVREAIETCRRAGIRVFMVTGDHRLTAEAIGRSIGLLADPHTPLVEGRELQGLPDSSVARILGRPAAIFARTSAEQKLRLVRLLRGRGDVVAVTGDGVNDAPALKAADVGVAMGRSGSDVAREAARMVLLDDDFGTIVAAIEEGRAVRDNVRKFITYIFSSNVPEIVPFLGFVLLGIPLPLTILQILAVDLGTDMLPALALGAERPSPDLMKRPPRARSERILDAAVLARSYGFLGPIEAAAAMSAYFLVLAAGGWTWGVPLASSDLLYRQATTACLAAIVVTQVANGLTCRSDRRSLASMGILTNRLLVAGIVCEVLLLLAAVYVPAVSDVLGTAPPPAFAWLVPVPFALLLLGADEIRKGFVRRARSGRSGPDGAPFTA